MRPLTKRQREILGFIVATIRDRDRFPSYREIGRRFGLTSTATVSQHLEALVAKGFLERVGRRLMLTPESRPLSGIPIVGRVAAGLPITAVENREGYLEVGSLFDRDDAVYFAVRVTGGSMVEAGILPGDHVIVRQQEDAADGDTVVAYLGDDTEATVKVLRRNGRGITLEPRNASYRSISIGPEDSLRIAGKVVGLIRKIK
jgi:repressor LexA